MLEKMLRISLLHDFYGALLTERQQQCLELHYLNDLSLSEIADQIKVSRQAVYDIVKRSEQILEDYEAKLGLVAKHQQERQIINDIYRMLNSLSAPVKELSEITIAIDQLKKFID